MTTASEHLSFEHGERLGGNEVHVWHFPYARKLGRQPLLAVLSQYLGRTPECIRLVEGEYGRPALAPGQNLEFNWSHSGEHAVIALARHHAIGVDVERARPRPKSLELARRFFHCDETTMLRTLPADQQASRFLELWTAKEAILKSLGRGIAFGLDRLVIEFPHDMPMRLVQLAGEDPQAWQLQPLMLGPALVGAVAWRGAPAIIRYRSMDTLPPGPQA